MTETKRRAFVATLVLIGAIGLAPKLAAQSSSVAPPRSELPLQEYLDKLSAASRIVDETPQSTVRAALEAQSKVYEQQVRAAAALEPPKAARQLHRSVVDALVENVVAYRAAALMTPADAPNTLENSLRYAYRSADVGYARGDEAAALCDMRNFAKQNGARLFVLGDCGATLGGKPGSTAGSRQQPVSNVTIVHDTVPGFVDDQGNALPRPNVDGFAVSTIYAKAGRPLTITFDNRNPAPFQFNIAVYRGDSSRVRPQQLVDGTIVAIGQKVHVLTVTLPPGVYSYVDNVHPEPMRGSLIVVR